MSNRAMDTEECVVCGEWLGCTAEVERLRAERDNLIEHANARADIIERLRGAVREWETKRRHHAGYVVYDEDLDELRALTKPEGE